MFGFDDAIGGVAGLGTSFAGKLASQGDKQAATKQGLSALQQWLSINVPDPEQQKIYLQHYAQTGQLHPDLEQAFGQGKTNLANVQTDPQYKEAELRALNQMSDLGTHGGHTLADDAQYQKSLIDVNSSDRGRRDAIANKFAARGMGGSGLELAEQLQGAQGATDRLANSSLDIQAQREKRALDALMGSGQLAGKMRAQDYGEQSDKATAQDAIDKFNTTNMRSVVQRNIDRQNDAQKYNLDTQQNIANKNVDVANQQEKYNKGLVQQQFENEVSKAKGTSGQYDKLGQIYSGNAQDTRSTFGGLGSAINQMGSQYSADKKNQDWLDAYKQKNQPQSESTPNANAYSMGEQNLSDDDEWWKKNQFTA
jgi:hypothetical protein